MFDKKKLLLKKAYEKAKQKLNRIYSSNVSVLTYLALELEEKFGSVKDVRTFVRYHKRLIKENKDYEIDEITLDQLSWYVGYENFEKFCENATIEKNTGETKIELKIDQDEDSISERLSRIIINITNQPIFNVPQLAKNGMGIGVMVLTLAFGLAYQGGGWGEDKYMYWNGEEYVGTSDANANPNSEVVAMDKNIFNHFKKITRPDTLTVENAVGKAWYSKYNNKVEFFTMDGKNPENGKELKRVSEHMVDFYAGIK
ncbi:hypothetical protein SAMN05421866_2184 [Chryseobacterium oranimense]|uniref:Uncharacterized protein n=1 Tax=Chryseobacterium oranimense TaxID=421058 RepID=A0A1M5QBR8_9FLAO|nr:hypothetical protein [Chryseobacterium oranimense]SHH11604.1 hypothetical protein SAMN05421866_2184 [Chryseobacterium oranimense]